MSQDQGRQAVRHTTPRAPARPSLDRPSLFAGMESDDSTLDDDMQRVRILSTLESARRPSRAAPSKSRRPRQGQGMSWQMKALMGLMGVGVLALLAAFVMVITDKRQDADEMMAAAILQPQQAPLSASSAAPQPTLSATPQASNNPLAALTVPPPAAPTASAPPVAAAPVQVAVIENVAPAAPSATPVANTATPASAAAQAGAATGTAGASPMAALLAATSVAKPSRAAPAPKASAEQPAASLAVVQSQARPTGKPATPQAQATSPASPAKAVAPVVATAASTRAAPNAQAQPNAPAASAAKPAKVAGARSAARSDDDVALLEAMFAHTGKPGKSDKRPANPSVGEQIKKQCNALSGAEAATCRARLCVQSPTAAECHQER